MDAPCRTSYAFQCSRYSCYSPWQTTTCISKLTPEMVEELFIAMHQAMSDIELEYMSEPESVYKPPSCSESKSDLLCFGPVPASPRMLASWGQRCYPSEPASRCMPIPAPGTHWHLDSTVRHNLLLLQFLHLSAWVRWLHILCLACIFLSSFLSLIRCMFPRWPRSLFTGSPPTPVAACTASESMSGAHTKNAASKPMAKTTC